MPPIMLRKVMMTGAKGAICVLIMAWHSERGDVDFLC